MNALRTRVEAGFRHAFGHAPTLLAQAPGRVNLIGEHTDYNDGFVLPCAIGYHTLVAAAPRDDAWVQVLACDLDGQHDAFRVDEPIVPRADQPWTAHVRGMLAVRQRQGLPLRGASLALAGNVPQGAGLSSSASLEVALAQVLRALGGPPPLTDTDLALWAQRAENDFVGCHCGVMDPLVVARAQVGHALLIDCRSLAVQAVPLPAGLAVLVVHSRVRRALVGSAYNERRQQCEAAARHCGVAALRDLDELALARCAPGMPPTWLRRAHHVVTENARTQAAAQALADADLATLGRLMAASQASMRDDFEITVPAIDQLVDILQQAIGSDGGARMTGGGFGGCVVALLPHDRVAAATQAVQARYRSPDGEAGTVWLTDAAAGAGLLTAAA
jgi:galactokinase